MLKKVVVYYIRKHKNVKKIKIVMISNYYHKEIPFPTHSFTHWYQKKNIFYHNGFKKQWSAFMVGVFKRCTTNKGMHTTLGFYYIYHVIIIMYCCVPTSKIISY